MFVLLFCYKCISQQPGLHSLLAPTPPESIKFAGPQVYNGIHLGVKSAESNNTFLSTLNFLYFTLPPYK